LIPYSGTYCKSIQAHDGWGDVFGAVVEGNSFTDEGVTTELEGIGGASIVVTKSSATQKVALSIKKANSPMRLSGSHRSWNC
jgi:hypothetical protein